MSKEKTVILAIIVAVLFIACNIACCIGGLVAGGFLSVRRTHRYPRMMPQEPMERWHEEPAPRERTDVAIVAMVVGVAEDGPAAEAGIEVGDMILAVDGERLQRGMDPREMLSAYQPGDRIELTIRRGERTRTVQVTLGSRADSDLPRLGLTYRIIPFVRDMD
jgi:S1-C subfamily serine protease